MANPDGMVLLAGGLAFTGSFIKSGGFPENGYAIIGGTVGLSFVVSLASETPLKPAVKAFTILVLLVAMITYIPGLSAKSTKRKKKNNG